MKKTFILILTVLFCITVTAQKSKVKYKPKGTWNFENSTAPPGYSTGTVEIKRSKKLYTVTFLFSGNAENYLAENVSFRGDSLQFSLNIQGMDMTSKAKFVQKDQIDGETYVMGTSVPFTLTRAKATVKSK
jgi:hypothetical protein